MGNGLARQSAPGGAGDLCGYGVLSRAVLVVAHCRCVQQVATAALPAAEADLVVQSKCAVIKAADNGGVGNVADGVLAEVWQD